MAPCWYVQIPWLLSDGEPAGFQGAMMSAPPERMLREIGAFLESWATGSTIVLVLEDLHWSDNATADLLSFLAQRRDPARLLILGTFRPVEAATHDHPIREVKQTLRARRRCVDLALDYLSTAEVREYLRGRFGDEIPDLAPLIHQRTDGNPLFVVALVEELIRRGQLALTGGGWAMSVAAEDVQLAVPEDLARDGHHAVREPDLRRASSPGGGQRGRRELFRRRRWRKRSGATPRTSKTSRSTWPARTCSSTSPAVRRIGARPRATNSRMRCITRRSTSRFLRYGASDCI